LKRTTLVLLTLVALFVAACASDPAGSSASQSAVTQESEGATPEPAESESAVAFPSFDLNGDPELAGRFPDTVGGQPLLVQSFRGDAFMDMSGSDPSFQAFLDSVGADMEDVSVAFGGSVSGESVLSVSAFRVVGASEDQLEREFIAASEEAGDVSGLTQTSLAGKDVWTASDPSGATEMSIYIYTKDDTVYFLTGTEEQVAEILEALP